MSGPLAKRYIGEVVLRRYLIEELVGEGSFAWVYRARDRDGEAVAVKVLYSTQPTAAVRFAREVRVLQALPDSPSIASYVDHGNTRDGRPALVLEFVDGITLKLGIERRPTLQPDQAVAFMGELCGAFVELHRLGVAHRDVKPENILLGRHGGIKLIDFGLIRDAQGILRLLEEEDPLEMRVFQAELDRGVLAGTPEYMAPEQFSDSAVADISQARTDTWSDVFSLGVILFELLTGRKPFVMRDVAREEYPAELLRYLRWRLRLRDRDIPRIPGISSALQSIVHKSLRRDPRSRQPDARAFIEDLQRYQRTGMGVTSTDESRTQIASIANMMADINRSEAEAAAAGEPRSSFSFFDDGGADDGDETARGGRPSRARPQSPGPDGDLAQGLAAEAYAETLDARRLPAPTPPPAEDATAKLRTPDPLEVPAPRRSRRRSSAAPPPDPTRDLHRPQPQEAARLDPVVERTVPLKPLGGARAPETARAGRTGRDARPGRETRDVRETHEQPERRPARPRRDSPVSTAPWLRDSQVERARALEPMDVDEDLRTGLHRAAAPIIDAPPTTRGPAQPIEAPPTTRGPAQAIDVPRTVRAAVEPEPPERDPDNWFEDPEAEENLADPPMKGEPAILTAPLDTPSLSLEDFYSDEWGSAEGSESGYLDDGFVEETGEVNLAELTPRPKKKRQ